MRNLALLLLVFAVPPARSVELRLNAELTGYGDNTEFFNAFRTGETLLGTYLNTYLDVRTGPRTGFRVGLFADQRSGSSQFTDPTLPILAYRYQTETSLGVIGTLETRERHGLLEPFEVLQLDITRPIEYGVQWIEKRDGLAMDLFLNWQQLVDANRREVFDYGGSLRKGLAGNLDLELQLHGFHRGGQIAFQSGIPVSNNAVYGGGFTLHGKLLGASRLTMLAVGSRDTFFNPAGITGWGSYAKASVEPLDGWDLFGIAWRARNFISAEGDAHFNSLGENSFFKVNRSYFELGVGRTFDIDPSTDARAEARSHWIEGALDYSFRLIVRVRLGKDLMRD